MTLKCRITIGKPSCIVANSRKLFRIVSSYQIKPFMQRLSFIPSIVFALEISIRRHGAYRFRLHFLITRFGNGIRHCSSKQTLDSRTPWWWWLQRHFLSVVASTSAPFVITATFWSNPFMRTTTASLCRRKMQLKWEAFSKKSMKNSSSQLKSMFKHMSELIQLNFTIIARNFHLNNCRIFDLTHEANEGAIFFLLPSNAIFMAFAAFNMEHVNISRFLTAY